MRYRLLALGVVCFCCALAQAGAATLVQLISREDPAFTVASARLSVGKDGLAYLSSSGNGGVYVVRFTADGADKYGGAVVLDGLTNAAANANGIVATANSHFNKSVNLYDSKLKPIGAVNDFLVSDAVGWDAPAWVEAGESGDFYGVDQHRNRVVRVSADAKEVTTYPIEVQAEKMPPLGEFRVCEATKSFYFREHGDIRCVGWDGKTKWQVPSPVVGDPWNGFYGGFDVDPSGELYIIGAQDHAVQKFTPDGKADGSLPLQFGDSIPTQASHIMDMRLSKSRIFIKRSDPIEIFATFDLASGTQKSTVDADVERLSVDYPGDTWTADKAAPITIKLAAGSRTVSPQWHVWLRPFGTNEYHELPISGGDITPPGTDAGLYQFKVSAGAQGDAVSEYMVQSMVEIRPAGAKGSATVMTPGSRMYYGRGEEIPVTVELRGAPADLPSAIAVMLTDAAGTVATATYPVPAGGKPVTFTLDKAFTLRLAPGSYRLEARAAGLTCMAQPLAIGPGMQLAGPFRNVQYGDYSFTYPTATFWNAPEVVADDLARKQKLGKDFFADRLGSGGVGLLQWANNTEGGLGLAAIGTRLGADPLAVAPDKLKDDSPYLQTVADYGAHGMSELGILMNMDAGLPIGTLWDPRKPEVVKPIISGVTTDLLNYPAFHGWVWAANWWPSKFGADAATDDAQKAQYNAAVKVANDTGKWDPIIDQVSNVWLDYIPHATEDFAGVLKAIDPSKVSDDSGPYRSVDVYPPISFKDADEIDLQYQAEQIQPPMVYPHDVDFQKRPGKPEWAHPEIWNDNGTGDQILPTSLMMMMRGTDGVGNSGGVPNWGRLPEDPRQSYFGNVTEYRSLGRITGDYGPWLTTLNKADSVAIVCSPRMFRTDNWLGIGGKHFTRLYEAYQACLYAHHPASFVFLEDMTPSTLKQYRAVLVIDQSVEMEPQLKTYLDAAAASGTAVFYDQTCRKELMAGYRPLPVSFNNVETASVWNDDSAYYIVTAMFHADAAIVANALDPVTPEIATVDKPDALMSVLASGAGRYLFVVNNTIPDLEPGVLWRMDNYITTRLPITVQVTLRRPGAAVYDVFGYRDITGAPVITANLGALPGRLYAILPAKIARVAVRGPKSVRPGQPFDWAASVRDSSGGVIDAAIPIRMRLLAGDGTIIDDRTLSANIPLAHGRLIAPVNLPDGPLTLEVTELFSGKRAHLEIETTHRVTLAGFGDATLGEAQATATALSASSEAAQPPVESQFGLHFRDIALSRSGDSVLATAMQWDVNEAAVDIGAAEPGKVALRKIGNGFAYAPQAAGDGFAAIGYDVNSPQGYFLYLTDRTGKPIRRFGLYGLPKRLRSWALPHLSDSDCHFAVSPDGGWVATSGDLGLALWSADGKKIMSHDSLATRRPDPIFAAGNETLIVPDNIGVTAYSAKSGESLWNMTLAATGTISSGVASADGRTVALLASTQGGRVYIVRDGKLLTTLFTPADAAAFSPDGTHIAITTNSQLLWYDLANGLQWSFTGDDVLHFPRVDPQGARIVVGSELGTLYVLSETGAVLLQRDMGALTSAQWLPSGGLAAATWMGDLIRLAPDYHVVWKQHIIAAPELDASKEITAVDTTPSVTIDDWTNSTPTPAPLTPNLLKDTNALVQIYGGDRPDDLQNPAAIFTDGSTDPPAKPWMTWTAVNYIDSGWTAGTSLVFDTWRTQLHVTGMTFVEDPAHPESWLRDMVVQYWDPVGEKWVTGPTLLSNSATHTHMFDTPIEASKFRLITSGGGQWPAGNVRLAEVVFHGTALGGSNPDVVAKRPVAVLFDEKETDVKTMVGFGSAWKFNYADAYSGGKSIEVEANQTAGPTYQPPYGHAIPNWDFPIAENPGPGEYRYLTLAWKAGSPQTTAMSIWVGLNWPSGGAEAVVGPSPWHEGIVSSTSFGNTPPQQWRRVTIDMWAAFKRPIHVYAMGLGATGGPALFDDITLSRTAPQ